MIFCENFFQKNTQVHDLWVTWDLSHFINKYKMTNKISNCRFAFFLTFSILKGKNSLLLLFFFLRQLLVEWVFFSNCASTNLGILISPSFLFIFSFFSFFFSFYLNNHEHVCVPFHNPNSQARLVLPWTTWALLGL